MVKKDVKKVVVISFGEGVEPVRRKIDFVITIDTTPSMQYVQNQARQNATKLVRELKATFPECRIGFMFNGDLRDDPLYGGDTYSVVVLQPTEHVDDIVRFIRETPSTHLARGNAAYQEVLWQANNQIRWRDDADRVMIMIGDTSPNDIYDDLNRIGRDAYEELKEAARNGVKIHAIQCPTGTRDVKFWKALASQTGGHYLDLYQFHEVLDIIEAACFNEAGSDVLAAFEKFLRDSGRYTRAMDITFATIARRKPTIRKSTLTPVSPSRFQVFEITEDDCERDGKIGIRDFVENQGFKFEKGRGFYELARTETIQEYKEIVVMERDTGDMFTGEENIRHLLNIPVGTAKVRLRDIENLDRYRIFVQSTSVNRRLVEGAMFLYDIKGLRTN